MELVAILSSGKGTWGQVAGLINRGEWDKIILVVDSFSEKFNPSKKAEIIKVEFRKPLLELKDELQKKLKDKIDGMEVALSIASGEGKEHMALIAALINIPVGIKFTALTKDGIIIF
jgi:cobalamin biosynthesis Co2+ chelatase CbiK